MFIGWTPIGVESSVLYGPPVVFGRYIGRRWMVGAEYGQLNDGVTTVLGGETGIKAREQSELKDASFRNLGAFVRWIPRDTLFLIGSLHQRTWDGTVRVNAVPDNIFSPRVPVTTDLSTEAWVVSVGIGNMWQLASGITLSGTWALRSFAISSSSSFKVPKQGLSTAEQAEARKQIEEIGESVNADTSTGGVAIFTIGLSF